MSRLGLDLGPSPRARVIGSKYEPVQNEESSTPLDALTEESGADFETAGALRGGRETFVTMKLPMSMSSEGRGRITRPHGLVSGSAEFA